MKLSRFVALGLAVALPLAASASSEDDRFATRGLGANSCTALTSGEQTELEPAVRAQLASWIGGYISYRNRTENGLFETMPVQNLNALAELTRVVCLNNPDALVESAVFALVGRMAVLGLPAEAPLQTLRNDEYEVSVREGVTLEVQKHLVAEGLLEEGGADGVFGRRTAEALLTFQEDRNLTRTGLPDAMTLFVIAGELAD